MGGRRELEFVSQVTKNHFCYVKVSVELRLSSPIVGTCRAPLYKAAISIKMGYFENLI